MTDQDTRNGQGLLRAILDEPESDDLRLIYADWLTDHGDPDRAEFIRAQVKLAGPLPGCTRFMYSCSEIFTNGKNRATDLDRLADGGCLSCKLWAGLTLRQERLLTPARFWRWFPEAAEGWTGAPAVAIFPEKMSCEVGHFDGDDYLRPRYYLRRGFIDSVSAPLDTLLAHLPDLLRQHPVQEVRVTDKRPSRWDACTVWSEHWSWWPGNNGTLHLADRLPAAVHKRLPVVYESIKEVSTSRDYLGEADALAALNRAVLGACREEARLLQTKLHKES